MIVLTELYDQERLKQMLVRSDSNFHLVNSRNIYATYKVLWYRFPSSYLAKRCKVDILDPGIMNIPNVPPEHLVSKAPYNLPLMPLISHLFLKLQTWSDHRAATRSDLQLKQYTDRRDIDQLLEIVYQSGDRIRSPVLKWLPESMVSAASTRLRDYLFRGSPSTRRQWEALGFVVQLENAGVFISHCPYCSHARS